MSNQKDLCHLHIVLTPEQYQLLSDKHAKKQKILFSAIKDRDGKGKLVDVVMPVTELDRANVIFERIMYQGPMRQAPEQEERPAPSPEKDRQEPSPGRDRQSPQRAQEGPQGPPGQARPEPQVEQRAPSDARQVGSSTPSLPSARRPMGDPAKKRFSVGTRLARYQNQILYTQRFQGGRNDE